MTKSFGAKLSAAIAHHGPVCVGIDPHPELLRAWELPENADGLEQFAEICVEAFDGFVAIVKPQVAFFESFGSAGIAVLERTISVLRASGTLVLADAKRGDIGTTMAAYARTWLADESPLCSDAVTVSPYLGFGSLEPALALAENNHHGVFVLAATSNPEGPQVQNAVNPDGRTVSQTIVDEVAACNVGEQLGSVGIVLGATLASAPDLTELNGPILLPGVGAQGGGPDEVRTLVGAHGRAAVPSASREILREGPSVTALRDALARTTDSFAFLQE